MKQILGDNQFFGVNHHDLIKGNLTKNKFDSDHSIVTFISEVMEIGLDGFMINSNSRGYSIVKSFPENFRGEIHYSIPYPHKFASMVNEKGMFSVLQYVLKYSSYMSLLVRLPQFFITGKIKFLLPLILDLEIPNNLRKGSYVYLQNIVTDLIIGFKRYDLLEAFCLAVIRMGFRPGLITLNPIILDEIISEFDIKLQKKLIVCFNINSTGFNVFPNQFLVESLILKQTSYKKMGMSIISSGGTKDIEAALGYIKKLNLDYVIYGSSVLDNVEFNYKLLKK